MRSSCVKSVLKWAVRMAECGLLLPKVIYVISHIMTFSKSCIINIYLFYFAGIAFMQKENKFANDMSETQFYNFLLLNDT